MQLITEQNILMISGQINKIVKRSKNKLVTINYYYPFAVRQNSILKSFGILNQENKHIEKSMTIIFEVNSNTVSKATSQNDYSYCNLNNGELSNKGDFDFDDNYETFIFRVGDKFKWINNELHLESTQLFTWEHNRKSIITVKFS